MAQPDVKIGQQMVLERGELQRLIDVLRKQGYQVIGPTVRDQAIVYDKIASADDLPSGWGDEQDAGRYRLKPRDDSALFGYVVGPHSWKKFLLPPVLSLWKARLQNGIINIEMESSPITRYAFIGVRSCELHAIAVQDKIFLQGEHIDPHYKACREQLFIVAVNCTATGGTCFCGSMKTGPKATSGYDIALTEIVDSERHYFLAESGSPRGSEIMQEVGGREAGSEEEKAAAELLSEAGTHMGRELETAGLKELLYRNDEHLRWERIASRCLTCANCTMVCPTCFCVTVHDTTDLKGEVAERVRVWDSCFTIDFSYIHGGSIRTSAKSRYRQWMTHKLASWVDQFGTFGCVGCGRCITWCPVGIDITEEARIIREGDRSLKTTTAIEE